MKSRMVVVLLALAAAVSSRAAQLIDEGVTFDAVTHYYTYHYAVDNTSGSEAVVEISVLVSPQNSYYLKLPPMIHTAPPGWQYVAPSLGGPNPPAGTFEQWYNQSGVAPGTYLSGFSFSTPYPPVPTATPNYFLYTSPRGLIDIGIVQSPQLPPSAQIATVPLLEERTLILLAVVLSVVAALAMRG